MQWTARTQAYYEALLAGHTEGETDLASLSAQITALSAQVAVVYDEIEVIDRHIHGRERWLSKLAVPAGNKVTESGLTPFQADSGNNVFGAAIQILDTSDTPTITGMLKFDIHRIFVTGAERTTPYRFRISYGTGTQGAAVGAGQYTELIFQASSPVIDSAPLAVIFPRLDVGIKAWVEVWNAGNTGTIDFFIGLHEYEE